MSTDDFYKAILDNLYDGVYFVDQQRRITYWNQGAERITGYKADQALGRSCSDNLLVHVDAKGVCLCLHGCPLSAAMQDGEIHEAPVFLRHASGHRVPVLVRVSPLRDTQGQLIGAVETFSDNSALVNTQKLVDQLRLDANLDPLTQVANRRGILSLLEAALVETIHQSAPWAVLMIDIDHFKQFNDLYGHLLGDQVLRMVARTLQSNIRASDGMGRWGGEEFLVILRNIDENHLVEIAQKLRILVETSRLPHEECELQVTISIGATLLQPGDTPESAIQRADDLLYLSKRRGRNRVSL